jgi:hypothetical protein
MPSSTKTSTTTRKPVKVWPGRKGVGKGGVVTQHGVTTTGYQRGCRCDLCREAATAAKRNAREAKRAAEAKAAKPAPKGKAVKATAPKRAVKKAA